MKTLILAAIRCSLMLTAVTASLFSVQPAQAYSVTLQQVGSNVVATGSGPINLTGLTLQFSQDNVGGGSINGALGILAMGPSKGNADLYNGYTGPASFGSGGTFFANTGSGDFVVIQGSPGAGPFLYVPQGYVSGAALSDSMTFNNATFASLGVIPGTYVWTWGTGLPNQNFTLVIGGAGVPDGGSTVSLLSCALLGLAALRRKLGC
jgi:hypothetical protein